jgi:hypothetical protein
MVNGFYRLLQPRPDHAREYHQNGNQWAGRAATPPEACGGPRGYMRILDQHKYYPPMAEQELVEKALQRMAAVLPDQGHREVLKELLDQGLERAVQRLKEYAQFQPDRFSLQEVNDRLVRFCPYGRAS